MLESASLLRSFIETFFGYGSWSAPLWFVGMEEGGGGSLAEIDRRILAWDGRGRQELEDLAGFHRAIGQGSMFENGAAPQKTWSRLIRTALLAGVRDAGIASAHEIVDADTVYRCTSCNLQLVAHPAAINSERISHYQQHHLARHHHSQTSLIELLPIPSPNTRGWLLTEPLGTRDEYKRRVLPRRIATLREKIIQHGPRVVVFYGSTYRAHYEAIAGARFFLLDDEIGDIIGCSSDGTLSLLTQHPASWGATRELYENAGALIRETLAVDGRHCSRL